MRRLMKRRAGTGFTLVEVLVSLAVISLAIMTTTPMYMDYLANSRLREGGNTLLSEALYTQAEAVKRNRQLRVVVRGGSNTVQVLDVENSNAVLRERRMSEGVNAGGSDVGITYGGQGRPVPFGTAVSINLGLSSFTCSTQIRCPGLRIDGGGGMRLCNNILTC